MPQTTLGIDFDAILPQEYTFTRCEKTYVARDDCPFEVVVAATIALAKLEEIPRLSQDIATIEEAEQIIDRIKKAIITHTADLFRDRNPAITDEEIGETFGLQGCISIIRFFSTRLGSPSVSPPSATENGTSASPKPSASAQKRKKP